jgi:hypothetical protein
VHQFKSTASAANSSLEKAFCAAEFFLSSWLQALPQSASVSCGVVVDSGLNFHNSANSNVQGTHLGRFVISTVGTNMFSIRGGDAGVKLAAFVFENGSGLTSQTLNELVANIP